MAQVSFDVAREQSVTAVNENVNAVKTTVGTINTNVSTINANTAKIGAVGDTGGSASAGTMMAKLNKLITDIGNFVANWTAGRAAKLDSLDTINYNASFIGGINNTANTINATANVINSKLDNVAVIASAPQNIVYRNSFTGIIMPAQSAVVNGRGRMVVTSSSSQIEILVDNQPAVGISISGVGFEVFFDTKVTINCKGNDAARYFAQTQ